MKLLDETIEYLEGKDIDPEKEVKWVGSRDGKYAMSFADFAKKFATLAYDNDYGGQEIAKDLVVVGEDWWLERAEYDGAEWWELKRAPILSSAPKKFKCVRGGGLGFMLDDSNEDSDDTKEPLIKDEKIRKAVRAWADAQGLTEVYLSSNGYEIYGGDDDWVIQFEGEPFPFADKNRTYTITELCGEEEE